MKEVNGFTFIEILVVTGLIAMISTLAVQVFVTTSASTTKSNLLQNIKQNGDYSLEIMTRMIQSAESIPTCTGAQAGSLAIVNRDGKTTTFDCAVDRIASTGALFTQYLTPSGLTCGGTLQFLCTPRAGIPSSVKITFTLSQTGSAGKSYEAASVPFQTTVIKRSIEPL